MPPVREVWLSARVERRTYTPGLSFDVLGPSGPGSLLTVHVGSGMLPLRVLGGNVAVSLGSSWGNAVTVEPAARATTSVHVRSGRKVTAQGVDPARVTGDLGRYRGSFTGARAGCVGVVGSVPFLRLRRMA